MTTVAVIAAAAENGVIGNGNALPWRIKSEMRHFRRTTLGKPVIMGRKTFESIGAPLKDRHTIVVTRDASFAREGVLVMHSLEEALALGMRLAAEHGAEEVMVAGGADIYRQALPLADKVYLTRVHAAPEGDAFFPVLSPSVWEEIACERHAAEEGESADYTVAVLVRKRAE